MADTGRIIMTICRGIVLQYPKQIQENLSQPSLKKNHCYDNLHLLGS